MQNIPDYLHKEYMYLLYKNKRIVLITAYENMYNHIDHKYVEKIIEIVYTHTCSNSALSWLWVMSTRNLATNADTSPGAIC